MGRTWLALAIFVLLSAAPASGQSIAAVQACARDAKKVCATAQSTVDQLAECIKANFSTLSEPCKAALTRTAAVRESCRTDTQQQCPAIKPGAGRSLLCIKQHFTALSAPCKDAIGQSAARRVGAR